MRDCAKIGGTVKRQLYGRTNGLKKQCLLHAVGLSIVWFEAFLDVAGKQQRRFRVLAARTVRFLPLPRLCSRSVRRRRGNARVKNLPLLLLQYPYWPGS